MAFIEGTGGGNGPTGDVRQYVADLTRQGEYVPGYLRTQLSQAGVIGQTSPLGKVIGKVLNATGVPAMAQTALWNVQHPAGALLSKNPMGGGPNAAQTGEVPWVAGRPWFHGSSSAFEKFDVGRTDNGAFYGPAHYITDDPHVASTYAQKGSGNAPNVTRYSFEPDQILDIRAALDRSDVQRVTAAIHESKSVTGPEAAQLGVAFQRLQAMGAAKNGLWQEMAGIIGPTRTNELLAKAGYDAIAYPGGKQTVAGRPHNALAVINPAALKRGGAPNNRFLGAPRPTR